MQDNASVAGKRPRAGNCSKWANGPEAHFRVLLHPVDGLLSFFETSTMHLRTAGMIYLEMETKTEGKTSDLIFPWRVYEFSSVLSHMLGLIVQIERYGEVCNF
jgi:hypothetical protein